MSRRDEIIRCLRSTAPYIKEKYGVRKLLLFGSATRGEDSDKSDVDIFVDMPPKAMNYFSLSEYLHELLGRKVDLVRNHSRLSDFFRKEVERDGIRILS